MTVEVRQYMRPHGNVEIQHTDLSDDLQEQYDLMIARGWNFGAEVLATGHVSLTIEDRRKGEDVDIRVVDNGPGIQPAMESMLRRLTK